MEKEYGVCSHIDGEWVWCVQPYRWRECVVSAAIERERKRGECSHIDGERVWYKCSHIEKERVCWVQLYSIEGGRKTWVCGSIVGLGKHGFLVNRGQVRPVSRSVYTSAVLHTPFITRHPLTIKGKASRDGFFSNVVFTSLFCLFAGNFSSLEKLYVLTVDCK